tara:strand:- start:108 stop:233 length:126 start_codon:yes stop_codon:yes gene_type:complete
MGYLKAFTEFLVLLIFFSALFIGVEIICVANDACYATMVRP